MRPGMIEVTGVPLETRENRDSIPPQVLDGLLEGAYADAPTIKREWLDDGDARAARREHMPGGTRYGPTTLCGIFIPQGTNP